MKVWKFMKPAIKGGKRVLRYTAKNHNWILAVLSILGLAGTAYAFTTATIKAVKMCEEKQVRGTKEVVKTVWKLFLPGIGFIFVTTLAICSNAHLNARDIATVTGLYAASKTDAKLIKEKVKELVGERKEEKIENEVEAEKVRMNPPTPENIIETGHGKQLFRMYETGVYFRASTDWVDLQFSKLNKDLDDEFTSCITFHRLNELLGLPRCGFGDAVWDKVDMKKSGYNEIVADVRSLCWETINGEQEVVSVLRCVPEPRF